MKKLLVFAVMSISMFAVFMYIALSTGVGEMIADMASWYDIEDYMVHICVAISLIMSCIEYTIVDVIEDLLHDVWELMVKTYRKVSRRTA